MRDPMSANAWRAAALALAAGWGVMACGGGGDERGEAPRPAVAASPPMVAVAASQVSSARPCPSSEPQPAQPPLRRDTREIEREFIEALRAEPAGGMGSGAGLAEIDDPFQPR